MKRFPPPQTVALACHPATPSVAVRGLTASARISGAGKLVVRFEVDADMSRIVMPMFRSPARTDGLWRHTCFELFVALPDSDAYCELNFSPSGEWAMYGFVGYRRGMTPLHVRRPPRIAMRPMPRGLILEAITYLEELPQPRPGAPLRAGAAAVIQERDAGSSYWALAHPAPEPDFHHAQGFVLEIGTMPQGVADLLRQAVGKATT
jgi:hypothetical protein